MEELEKDIDAVARDARTLGYWNLIVPSIPQQRRQDAAGWKQAAQTMGDRAAECHRRGFELAYHNHAFEFTLFDGKSGFDIFWGASDYKLLKSELDVYWVARGGADPVAWIKRLSGRLLAVHLKDMASGADSKFAPVGSGILDMTAILAAAKAAGAHFQVVEQDNTYGTNPLEAARESLENLKHWGAV